MDAKTPVEGADTKTEAAYTRLREMIETGKLKVGEPLSESRAANLVGLGRGPVRESIKRLEGEGLMSGQGNRRSRVVGYVESEDPQEVVRRYEIRECIESCAAGLAAKYMNGIQIEHLLALAKAVTDPQIRGNHRVVCSAGGKFHEYLLANCGNPVLYRIWLQERLAPLAHVTNDHDARFRALMPEEDRGEEHIINTAEAIAAHDQETAEAVMRNHQRKVTAALRRSLWLNGEPSPPGGGLGVHRDEDEPEACGLVHAGSG